MISLISASNKDVDNILIESALNKLTNISEIIILYESNIEAQVTMGIIKKVNTVVPFDPSWVYAHPILLHRGLDIAKNDLVMFCDDDIFFLADVANIYLNYMDQGFDMVGVSHYKPDDRPMEQAFGYFPTVINMLIDKNKLPPADWMGDKIKARRWITTELDWDKEDWPDAPGKYLLAGPIPDYSNRFYNPKGTFNVGCNLYLWGQNANLNYLCFGAS